MITQKYKYKYKKYSNSYPEIFEKEKNILSSIHKVKIEHIGSTAVKNLGGKGIIDILIGTKKTNMLKVSNQLQKKGFILINKESNRWFFEKDVRLYKNVKRIHIQLVIYKGDLWNNAIFFRNYLIDNDKAKREYGSIKKKASILAKGDGFTYRIYKNNFINRILKQANKDNHDDGYNNLNRGYKR